MRDRKEARRARRAQRQILGQIIENATADNLEEVEFLLWRLA